MKNRQFDVSMLNKLICSIQRDPILVNVTVQVPGFSEDHRCSVTLAGNNSFQQNSLTRNSNEMTLKRTRGRSRSKLYQTETIRDLHLVGIITDHLKKQLSLDDELEDARI